MSPEMSKNQIVGVLVLVGIAVLIGVPIAIYMGNRTELLVVADDGSSVTVTLDGEVVGSETVDEKGFILPGSFIFKAEPVDQQGNLTRIENCGTAEFIFHGAINAYTIQIESRLT